jgi:hypothetical protein
MSYAIIALIIAVVAVWWIRELRQDDGSMTAEEMRRLDEVRERHSSGFGGPKS